MPWIEAESTISRNHKTADGYIKGTVGAGDAFCAEYCTACIKWDKPRFTDSIRRAACCLSEMNATDGMRI